MTAAPTTVEALMYSLRRGVEALRDPNTLRRLGQLDEAQAREAAGRVRKFMPHIAPAWEVDEVEALLEVWMTHHG
jgi:hypothetical protein